MSSDAAPSEARRTVNANEHATPQPTRSYAGSAIASTSTRALNQASSSSLAAQAAAQSSPGTTRTGNTSQITVESALALANGSYEVALAHVVDERNSIYNQNTMLWKHVEKTKSAVAAYKKDLERVRAERDRALARIQLLTGEEPRMRPSTQRNASLDTPPPSHAERSGQPIRHLSDAGPLSTSPNVYHILISKNR
jgi:RalA-binding protein 1